MRVNRGEIWSLGDAIQDQDASQLDNTCRSRQVPDQEKRHYLEDQTGERNTGSRPIFRPAPPMTNI